MSVLAGLAARRLAAVALSFALTTAVPFVLQDRPRLKWAWDKMGPRIVDTAQTQLESRLGD